MLFKVANVITGAGSEDNAKDEGASLTSVLETPQLRIELALLILLCTDAMRGDLIATFDPNKTHETTSGVASISAPTPKARTPTQDLISFDEPRDDAALAAERARRSRQQEVESPQMQALRRSALTFFDKWRAGVMHRICDVLCVRGDIVRQAKTKRKQLMDDAEKQKQGISSLIDFEIDPFASETYAKSGKKKHGHYDVIESKLLAFDEQKRVLILHCLLLLLLSLEHYSAHSRVLLLHLASSLELETDLLAEHEKSIAQGLLATAASQMDAEETAKKQASNGAAARRWKVGLAAVGGAVLIGVTGGLAAPLLAAGLGTVMGGLGLGVVSTYLGALAGSSVLVGSLFGAYGAKMTGRLMDQYAKEVQDFEFVPVQDPDRSLMQRDLEWADEQDARDPKKREQHRLRVCIGVSGWLSSPSDVNKPWEVIESGATEPFALRFELDAMLRLGNSLNDVLFSYAWDGVTYTVVSRTLLGALYAGLWPLGLIKAASVLENPFSVALARADKAGKVLAHALLDGVQGKRPVTLMGYSVGARVIYACLLELAEQHAFGLVESVVLMGTPAPASSKSWRRIRSVVAARVVNVYSTEDYVLGFLYRSTKLEFGVAGLKQVDDVYGIENVDMSKLVSGHDKYRYLVGTILGRVGFGDLNFNRVAEQERALEVAEKKKREIKEEAEKSKVEAQQQNASAPASTEMETIQGRSHAIVNVFDEQAPSKQPPPLSRPAIIPQPRSGQQPAIQRSRGMEASRHKTSSPPMTSLAPQSDPLTAAAPLDKPLHSTTEYASALYNRQEHTKMAANPTTNLPPTDPARSPSDSDEREYKITMKDSASSPPRATKAPVGGAIKAVPAVTVTEIAPSEREGHAVEANVDSSDDDEDNSDFGELSMVEPVPMDDFDYGLM
ncbi:hypothetical protein BKA66DRAFT_438310 [Pyrenochaeta sp. MPI-SDFR-AT-0127]|nr:hypothetical protein BKA66DRAFT_438310 [Pyrenochaeta sp. MPI-SDFR-AT-0127]